MHSGRNFSERNFGKLKNSSICGNKLRQRLSLSKEAEADDEIEKESSIKSFEYYHSNHRHLDNYLTIWRKLVYLKRQKQKHVHIYIYIYIYIYTCTYIYIYI